MTTLAKTRKTRSLAKAAAVSALLAAGLWAGSAVADATYPMISGEIAGTDPFPGPLNESPALAKFDVSDDGYPAGTWLDGDAPGDYSGAFTITFTDGMSGSWTFNPNLVTGLGANPVLFPSYIAVKGGDGYLIYTLDPTVDSVSGNWSTEGLSVGSGNTPALSHISFYDTGTVVPLPAAAWLFGSALLGMAGIGARRQSKKA